MKKIAASLILFIFIHGYAMENNHSNTYQLNPKQKELAEKTKNLIESCNGASKNLDQSLYHNLLSMYTQVFVQTFYGSPCNPGYYTVESPEEYKNKRWIELITPVIEENQETLQMFFNASSQNGK